MDLGLYHDDEDDSIVIADPSGDPETLIRISFEGLFAHLSDEIQLELASGLHRNLAAITTAMVATRNSPEFISGENTQIADPHKDWPGDSYDHVERLESKLSDTY